MWIYLFKFEKKLIYVIASQEAVNIRANCCAFMRAKICKSSWVLLNYIHYRHGYFLQIDLRKWELKKCKNLRFNILLLPTEGEMISAYIQWQNIELQQPGERYQHVCLLVSSKYTDKIFKFSDIF